MVFDKTLAKASQESSENTFSQLLFVLKHCEAAPRFSSKPASSRFGVCVWGGGRFFFKGFQTLSFIFLWGVLQQALPAFIAAEISCGCLGLSEPSHPRLEVRSVAEMES